MEKVRAIDVDMCLRGMASFYVVGVPTNEKRESLVNEALVVIKNNPAEALKSEFFGIKNYSAFGDQRCDCGYGMGPRHGSIVFSVKRNRKNTELVDLKAVSYLFMAVLDFGFVGEKDGQYTCRLNLCDVIHKMQLIMEKHSDYANSINNIEYNRVKEFCD